MAWGWWLCIDCSVSFNARNGGSSNETFKVRCKIKGGDSFCTADSCVEWHGNPCQRMLWIAENLCEVKSRLGKFMKEKLRITEYIGITADTGRP